MEGVKHARARLRYEGMDPEIQKKIDEACVTPHIHPRWKRNQGGDDKA